MKNKNGQHRQPTEEKRGRKSIQNGENIDLNIKTG